METSNLLVPNVGRVFDGVKVGQVAGILVVVVTEFAVEIGVDPCDGIRRDPARRVGRAFRRDVEFDRLRGEIIPQRDEKSALEKYDEFRWELVSFDEVLHEIASKSL